MGQIAKFAIIAGHAVVGWAFCGAIVAVGRQIVSMNTTLIAHAIGAPLGFAAISRFYFGNYGVTSPLQTAVWFLLIVVVLDVVVVSLLIEQSFSMFSSPIGTWIPFALIFAATYLTGVCTKPAVNVDQ